MTKYVALGYLLRVTKHEFSSSSLSSCKGGVLTENFGQIVKHVIHYRACHGVAISSDLNSSHFDHIVRLFSSLRRFEAERLPQEVAYALLNPASS